MYNDVFRDTALFLFRAVYATDTELFDVYDEMLNYDLINATEDEHQLFKIIIVKVHTLIEVYEKMKTMIDDNQIANDSNIVSIRKITISKFEKEFKKLFLLYEENLRFLETLQSGMLAGYVQGKLDIMDIIK